MSEIYRVWPDTNYLAQLSSFRSTKQISNFYLFYFIFTPALMGASEV